MNGPSLDERLVQIIQELQHGGITLGEAADAFDAKYVRVALEASQGNITAAARRIGLHRNSLLNRLRENEALRVKPKKRAFAPGFDRWKGGRKGGRRS